MYGGGEARLGPTLGAEEETSGGGESRRAQGGPERLRWIELHVLDDKYDTS